LDLAEISNVSCALPFNRIDAAIDFDRLRRAR
jgi:hypothetical protein